MLSLITNRFYIWGIIYNILYNSEGKIIFNPIFYIVIKDKAGRVQTHERNSEMNVKDSTFADNIMSNVPFSF